eukprot:15430706-Alexandrium_andersonii.AAC.1
MSFRERDMPSEAATGDAGGSTISSRSALTAAQERAARTLGRVADVTERYRRAHPEGRPPAPLTSGDASMDPPSDVPGLQLHDELVEALR